VYHIFYLSLFRQKLEDLQDDSHFEVSQGDSVWNPW